MLKKFAAFLFLSTIIMIGSTATVSASTTAISPYSWDPGLYGTVSRYSDDVHAWGRRSTQGAWGTNGVNYQSGATANSVAAASGSINVVLNGTYCPGGTCSYGNGTGYKGIVQLWNDPGNYIAFGLIKDPGVSPNGMTLMIEGAAGGRPVGGYWPANAITGTSHLFTVSWSPAGIVLKVDNQITLGPYPVAASHPSISFLTAGRATGDIPDTTFTNISFSPGSIAASPIYIPAGNPYATYSATLTESGTGTGHSSYINMHDAGNNALAVGIQSDTGSPISNGQPYFLYERVQNGRFTYNYLAPASRGSEPVTLKWWKSEDTAVFYAGNTPLVTIDVHLEPRLFFNAEANARLNGDSVNSNINNVLISIGDTCPTYCGLNGTWNTSDFNFYGLIARKTNSSLQNGANFNVSGTVSGLPPGADWDSQLVAGIGMIAQYWNGQ